MSRSCRDTLPDVREWLGGPHRCPRVVGRPSGICGSGQEALSDVWEWSGAPPESQGVLGRT